MMILATNNEHSSKEVESGEDHSSRIITTNNTDITERDVEIGGVGSNQLLFRDDDDDNNNVDSTTATTQAKGSINSNSNVACSSNNKSKSNGYDIENNSKTAADIAAAAAAAASTTTNNNKNNFSTISNCSSRTSHSSNRVKKNSTTSSNDRATTTTTRNEKSPSSPSSSSSRILLSTRIVVHNRYMLSLVIVMVGVAVGCLFLKLGIHSATKASSNYFHRAATDIAHKIELSWHDYEIFSLWAHESCHKFPHQQQTSDTTTTTTTTVTAKEEVDEEGGESTFLEEKLHICSREEFRNLYEHISSLGLNLYSLQYVTRVEHQYRTMYEHDSRQYLATHYPHIPYSGITARNGPNSFNQTKQEVYYPVSRVEPIEGNEAAIDLDTYHSAKALIDQVLSSWKPTLSPGVKLIQDRDPDAYSVYLVHPGIHTSIHKEAHSVTSTVIRIHDLLSWAAAMGDGGSINGKAVYIFDSTDQEKDPTFLGGVEVGSSSSSSSRGGGGNGHFEDIADDDVVVSIKPLQETTIKKVQSANVYSEYFESELKIVDRRWTVAGTFLS